MKSYFTIFLLLTFVSAKNLVGQTQWFPAILVDKDYIRDTALFRYPVSNIIEEDKKIILFGRGTRYPSKMKYDNKQHCYISKNGIIMTTRPDNTQYYSATYLFRKINKKKAILTILKSNNTTEEIIYVPSLLPVKYPPGN